MSPIDIWEEVCRSVELSIDGATADPRNILMPEMSLSSGRTGMVRHNFHLDIPARSLVRALEAVRASEDRDLACWGDTEFQLEIVRMLDPRFDQLSDWARSRSAEDMLALITQRGRADGLLRYWIDELHTVRVEHEHLVVDGVCYSLRA